MLQSMTGYGSAEGRADSVHYVVEIRSVNHRYFRLYCRLPEGFTAAEAHMESLLRERLVRGSITISVKLKVPQDQSACSVNIEALSAYIEQLRSLEIDANPTLRIDLGAMLQLPGVCNPPRMEDICSGTLEELLAMVEQAVGKVERMRIDEGRNLLKELLDYCKTIEDGAARIADRAPQVVRQYRARLEKTLQELVPAERIEIDQDVLAREVVIFAERSDITEELTRMNSHLEQFRRAMKETGPVGRKLDFIAQEMHREANTVQAKANDAEISQIVIEVKTAIDRIKEQVQNVL